MIKIYFTLSSGKSKMFCHLTRKERIKNMETKSKRTAYLVMFIAFAVVVLGAGTYAYLTNSQGVGDVLNASTSTAKQATFTAYHDGELTFNISATQMAQMAVSNKAIAEDNASLTVELTGTSDYEATRCTYDVVWVWDSTDVYTQADTTLPLTGESGTIYDYEFSVKLNDDKERDLSDFTWSDDGKEAILIEDQIITSRSNTDKIIQEYEVVVRMYNIETAQRNLFDKTFKGHIEMKNYTCDTDLTENIAESTQTMDYYLYNENTGVYETSDLSSLNAAQKYYSVNSETECAKAGKITYDSQTDKYVSNIENDTCLVYVDVNYTETIAADSLLAAAIVEQGESNSVSANGAWGIVSENGYRYEGSDYVTPGGEDTTNIIACPTSWSSCTFVGDSTSATYASYREAAEAAVDQGVLKDSGIANYVCFDEDCTDGEYRIIGAFKETYDADGDGTAETTGYLTKIIRNELIENADGSVLQMAFETDNISYWIGSDMETYLHGTYADGLSSTVKSYAMPTTYYLGNVTYNNKVGGLYTEERGTAVHDGRLASDVATYGLIYPSDYGYAAFESKCSRATITGTNDSTIGTGYYLTACSRENWMYITGRYGQISWWWTISPNKLNAATMIDVARGGEINQAQASGSKGAVRPSWYLRPETKVVSGNGTIDNPYILGM